MAFDLGVNCTLCQCLAGDFCTFHEVELDNPAYTVCGHFRQPDEAPEAMHARFPGLSELAPDWIYEIDAGGEPSPLLQVARRRRQRPGRGTGTGKLGLTVTVPQEVVPPPSADLAERFRGAMAGVALGDALGFPAEGRSPAEIEMIYGGPLTGPVGRIGRHHHWPVGQVTKDSQLTVCLGESLAQAGRLELDDFVERLVRAQTAMVRPGKSTLQAIQAMAEGRHWSVTGLESNGAGSTVRMVPLALLRHRDYARLRQEAIFQSLPTHAAPKAYAGAVLFGSAIASLVNTSHGELGQAAWLGLLERAIRGIDLEASAKLHDVAALLAQDTPALEALARFKSGGFVLECLPSALYCFLSYPDHPERAMLTGVNGGFDASSVGAMIGALCGAYHGLSGLPGSWLRDLPMAASMNELADRLHAQLTPDLAPH